MKTALWSTRCGPISVPPAKLLLVLFALSFTSLFLPLLCAEDGQEPSYKGKPLSYWLDDYADLSREVSLGLNPTLKAEQTDALLHIGTNAVPWLIKRLSMSPHFSRDATILAFRVLGPLAHGAIPELVQLVTNQPESFGFGGDGPRDAAFRPIQALGGIGKDAVPALLEILTNSMSPVRRFDALEAIARVGTNAVFALPGLIHYVYDTNVMVSVKAVETVVAVGARQPAGLQALKQILQTSNLLQRRIRWETFSAMRGFGEDCAPAVIPALDDKDDYFIAFATLVDAAPDTLTNAAVLRSAATGLQSRDFKRQNWAAQLLRAAGQQARGQRPDYAVVGFDNSDYSVPGGDMKAIHREATNALSRLSSELYNEYVAAQVPFHPSDAH